ncbi:MAG: DUF5666 domain-containing protein [Chloroflexota bacterium]
MRTYVRGRWMLPALLLAGLALSGCAGGIPTVLPGDVEVDLPEGRVEFTGVIDAMEASFWTVSGQTVGLTAETEIQGDFSVGDAVKVEATVSLDGSLTAREIKPAEEADGLPSTPEPDDEVEFTGVVEAIGADSWTVAGQMLLVTADTETKGTIAVGDTVKVHAFLGADGSLTAREIEPAEGDEGQDSSPDESKVEFSGVVEAMGAESWTISGQVVAITTQTEIDDGIAVGDTVKVEAFVAADGTLTAHEISRQDGSDEDHAGLEIEVVGLVEAIGGDTWTIAGQTFTITADIEIDEGMVVGDQVKVEAFVAADGTLTVKEIQSFSGLSESRGDDDGDHDGEDSNDDHEGDDD